MELSIWKLLLILLVALIVLGPEQLPKVARTLGRLLGQMRGTLNALQKEVQQLSLDPPQEKKSAGESAKGQQVPAEKPQEDG